MTKRTEVIGVRWTKAERKDIEKKASYLGLKPSEYIRQSVHSGPLMAELERTKAETMGAMAEHLRAMKSENLAFFETLKRLTDLG